MSAPEIAHALAAALALAAEGLPSFPLRANKRPACPGGFHAAAGDTTAVRDLWHCYPGPLVGVPTGGRSGIDVLDLDRKHRETGVWWAANRHRLPETRAHRTRSGGLHLFFQHDSRLRCWTGRPMPGIDGRAGGGYIVWWPAAGLPVLRNAPLALWPAWLLAELQPSTSPERSTVRVTVPDEHALAGLVRFVAGAPPGQRNNVVYWAGCRAGEMVASGLISAETAATVIAHAAMRAGLSRLEAERTASSGLRTGRRLGNA
jgi:hypothetical protein